MELTPTSLILKVSVGKGTNFATGWLTGVSPFVVIAAGGHRVQTKVVSGKKDPEWNQDFLFVVENPVAAQLKIDVLTKGAMGDRFLGSCTVGLQGLVMGRVHEFTFPMLRGGGKKEKAAIMINLMSLNMTVPGTVQLPEPVVGVPATECYPAGMAAGPQDTQFVQYQQPMPPQQMPPSQYYAPQPSYAGGPPPTGPAVTACGPPEKPQAAATGAFPQYGAPAAGPAYSVAPVAYAQPTQLPAPGAFPQMYMQPQYGVPLQQGQPQPPADPAQPSAAPAATGAQGAPSTYQPLYGAPMNPNYNPSAPTA